MVPNMELPVNDSYGQMPEAIRATLITFAIAFLAVGGYYRIQSQRSGERLDRTKEGWPILIGIRLFGLLTFGSTIAWLWKPALFGWASYPMPIGARWVGVAGFACSIGWLIWMFHTLGRNLTDTVVTRRNAYFVDHGPYRFVRNPMYSGIPIFGISLGLALGTWLLPVAASVMFIMLALRTRTEEQYLLERFGDQYRAYSKRVGRFFPKL
jgi:protein-S-isoprenylcysteine O-methyltransferase Ste14